MKRVTKRIVSLLLTLCMVASVITAFPITVSAAEDGVTRGEWISSLVETFAMTVEEDAVLPDNYFGDITDDMEYYEDILLAVEFGVIDLEAGEDFRPDDPVTREFAAQTLNYCLNFQLDENTEYTYSESAEVSYPDDIQVAVNRGWFALSGSNFLPQQEITQSEMTAMLDDAKTVIEDDVIDENYESKFEFAEGVVVIPQGTNVAIADDYTVTITDYETTVKADDVFVVFTDKIPVALKATEVTTEDNITTIRSVAEGAEEAITSVDSEGVMEIALENFEAEEVETFSVLNTASDDEESEELKATLQSIEYDKKTKTLKAIKDVKLSRVYAGSISVEISDMKLYHKENAGSGQYEAYITAKTSVTKTISFDFGSYVGLPNKITLGYVNIGGIGNVALEVDISLKGGMSETEEGNIMAGFEYIRNGGFRLIKGYQKTSYSFTAEAEVKVGLTLSANIKLVFVKGRIWATVGVKGTYKMKDYTYVDAERPLKCETIRAYLYANVGASATINYFVDQKSWSKAQDIYTESNSPVRVYYHYEDGDLVDSCTRDKTDNDTYTKYTTKTTSKYFNPSPSYAKGSYTNNSDGTTTTVWTYTVDGSNATITGYKGSATAIAIPSKIDGYTVTAIGSGAFRNNKNLKAVTMPDSVIEIQSDAFSGCTNLKNVKLSNNLEQMDYCVFNGCTSLTEIKIPKSLTYASSSYGGIFGDSGLTSVEFEEGTTKVVAGLFWNAQNLVNVPLLDTMTEIGDSAFGNCASLESIVIPDTVTIIGSNAFGNCTSLESVVIPDSVVEIQSDAFRDCTSLEKVKLSNNYNEVPADTFYNCSNLKDITLPETLEKINRSAFYGCSSLEKLDLPETLETIDDSAFYECKALTEITVPENVTYIGSEAFYNCDALTKAEIKGSGSIDSEAFYDCDSLVSISIADGVTSIGSNMCYGCDKLAEVKLGKGITKIPDSAFRLCQSLETVTIPRFCTTIASNAFAEDTKLKSAYVPASVTGIETNSFSYPAKMTMYGKADSYAQEYAESRNMAFNAVNQPITKIEYKDSNIEFARWSEVTPAIEIMPDFDTDIVTFTSDNTEVATVSEAGAIYGQGYGTANITATTSSGLSTTIAVNIIRAASRVTLDKTELQITQGETEALTATLSPDISTDKVEWKSSNPSVATVDENGKVTALKTGTATITATAVYGDVSATCEVVVMLGMDFSVDISGSQATASVSVPQLSTPATVYIAAFDSRGRLVDIQLPEISGDSATAVFGLDSVYKFRAFLWEKDSLIPLANSKEYNVN